MKQIILIIGIAGILLNLFGCETTQHRRFNYFMSVQDNEGAESYLQTEIRRNPGNPELHYLLGKVYLSNRDFVSAKESFDNVKNITPQYDEDISFLLERHFRLELQAAMEAVESRNYTNALEHLQKARDIDDSRDEIYPMLGYANLQLRDDAEAENAYRRAIALNHRNTGALYNLAELAFRKRDYAEAVRYAERTLSVDHEHAPAHRISAYSYLELGYFDEAEEAYNAFFRYDHSNSFRYNFAIGLYNNGDYVRAVQYLLSLVERGQADDEVLLSLAESYRYLENYRNMAHWYERLHRLQPDNRDVIKNLIYAYEMIGEKSNSEKYRKLLQ